MLGLSLGRKLSLKTPTKDKVASSRRFDFSMLSWNANAIRTSWVMKCPH